MVCQFYCWLQNSESVQKNLYKMRLHCYSSHWTNWKDTSIKAIILRHVSRLKPSVFISLSVGKGQLGMIKKQVTHNYDLNLSSVLTFGEDVLHDRLEFVGTDLHVLMEGGTICCILVQMLHSDIHTCPVSSFSSLSNAPLPPLCTHFTSNLLVNGSELFFFFSLLLSLE